MQAEGDHMLVLLLEAAPASLERDGSFLADLVPRDPMEPLSSLFSVVGTPSYVLAADLPPASSRPPTLRAPVHQSYACTPRALLQPHSAATALRVPPHERTGFWM